MFGCCRRRLPMADVDVVREALTYALELRDKDADNWRLDTDRYLWSVAFIAPLEAAVEAYGKYFPVPDFETLDKATVEKWRFESWSDRHALAISLAVALLAQ